MSEGWSSNNDDVVKYETLAWLLSMETMPSVRLSDFFVPAKPDLPRSDAAALVRQLKAEGMLELYPVMAGDELDWQVKLTDSGLVTARRNQSRAGERKVRRVAVRDALLDYMDTGVDCPPTNVLRDPRGHIYGVPFTVDEVKEATVDLNAAGLLEGITAGGYSELVRANITPLGQTVAEDFDCDVVAWRRKQYPEPGGSQVTNNIVNIDKMFGGQAAAGSNVTQAQHTGADLRHVRALIQAVRDQLPQIEDEDSRQDAAAELVEIEEEVSTPAPDAGRLRRRLKALATIAGTAGLTGAVEPLAAAIARHLGLG